MKTTKLFNVYSFFVLGILLGAVVTRFFIAWSTGSDTFKAQSYDAALPNEGFIVNTEAFDVSCVSVSCEETCLSMGRSDRECKNACADPVCTWFVDKVKGGQHAVADDSWSVGWSAVLNNFGNWGQRRTVDDSVRNAEQNKSTTGITASRIGFDYKIDSNTYNDKCEQYACYNFCISKKWLWGEEFCRENCVSSVCMQTKNQGKLENYKIK